MTSIQPSPPDLSSEHREAPSLRPPYTAPSQLRQIALQPARRNLPPPPRSSSIHAHHSPLETAQLANNHLNIRNVCLTQQLWRQGQAYQRLALHCNYIHNTHTASDVAFHARLGLVQRELAEKIQELERERQKNKELLNAHQDESAQRAATEEILANEGRKLRSLALMVTRLGLMTPEHLGMLLNSNVDVEAIASQQNQIGNPTRPQNGEMTKRQAAFTLECYRRLVGHLRERHNCMDELLKQKEEELGRMREELDCAIPRTAMVLRRRLQ